MVETALALPSQRPGVLSRLVTRASSWWNSRRAVTTFAAPVAPRESRLGRGAPRDNTNAWPLWLSSGLTPEKLSNITRNADLGYLGYQMALLQEITGKDGLVQGLMAQRLSALSQRKLTCKPSPADRDPVRREEVALFCQQVVDGLRLIEPDQGDGYRELGGLPAVVEQLDKAFCFGSELSWNHWGVRQGDPLPVPRFLEPLDERRYSVDIFSQSLHLGSGITLGTPISAYDPALITEVRYSRLSRLVAQSGAGRAILVPWSLRFSSLKDMISYLQMWGLPSLIGTMAADVSGGFREDMLAKYQRLLDDTAGDTRIAIPGNFTITPLSAVAGGEKIFETLDDLTERAMQFAIKGETGTSAANNTNKASAEVSERVFDNLVEGDARMVCGAVERLLSHAVALWFGVGTPPPEVKFERAATLADHQLQADTYTKVGQAIKSLKDAGVAVDVAELCKRYEIPILAATPPAEGQPQ